MVLCFTRTQHGLLPQKIQRQEGRLPSDLRILQKQGEKGNLPQGGQTHRVRQRAGQREDPRPDRPLPGRSEENEREKEKGGGGVQGQGDRGRPDEEPRLFPREERLRHPQGGAPPEPAGEDRGQVMRPERGRHLARLRQDSLPVQQNQNHGGGDPVLSGARPLLERPAVRLDTPVHRRRIREDTRDSQPRLRGEIREEDRERLLRRHELLFRDRQGERRQKEGAVEGKQKRPDHLHGAASGRGADTFGDEDVPRQRVGEAGAEGDHQGHEGEERHRRENHPGRGQGPELREKHMRGAEERGRIHLLPVGEAPAGAGKEMGLAREQGREMGGSQGWQRGVAVQIQILRRQVPVQGRRRERPADHGRSDPEKSGHLQPPPGGEEKL